MYLDLLRRGGDAAADRTGGAETTGELSNAPPPWHRWGERRMSSRRRRRVRRAWRRAAGKERRRSWKGEKTCQRCRKLIQRMLCRTKPPPFFVFSVLFVILSKGQPPPEGRTDGREIFWGAKVRKLGSFNKKKLLSSHLTIDRLGLQWNAIFGSFFLFFRLMSLVFSCCLLESALLGERFERGPYLGRHNRTRLTMCYSSRSPQQKAECISTNASSWPGLAPPRAPQTQARMLMLLPRPACPVRRNVRPRKSPDLFWPRCSAWQWIGVPKRTLIFTSPTTPRPSRPPTRTFPTTCRRRRHSILRRLCRTCTRASTWLSRPWSSPGTSGRCAGASPSAAPRCCCPPRRGFGAAAGAPRADRKEAAAAGGTGFPTTPTRRC